MSNKKDKDMSNFDDDKYTLKDLIKDNTDTYKQMIELSKFDTIEELYKIKDTLEKIEDDTKKLEYLKAIIINSKYELAWWKRSYIEFSHGIPHILSNEQEYNPLDPKHKNRKDFKEYKKWEKTIIKGYKTVLEYAKQNLNIIKLSKVMKEHDITIPVYNYNTQDEKYSKYEPDLSWYDFVLFSIEKNKGTNKAPKIYLGMSKDKTHQLFQDLYNKKYIDKESLQYIDEHFSTNYEEISISTKINWINTKVMLCAFIQSLINLNIMDTAKQWLLTSKHFTWQGKEITPSNLNKNNSNISDTHLNNMKSIINKIIN